MTFKTKSALTGSGTEEPPMELNIPEVVAEVRAAFLRYQHAVDTKDVETMNELFWTSPFTVRFGPNGTLIGHDAIANYRQTRTASAEPRALQNTVMTTFGREFSEPIPRRRKRKGRASAAKVRFGSVRLAAGASLLPMCRTSRSQNRRTN